MANPESREGTRPAVGAPAPNGSSAQPDVLAGGAGASRPPVEAAAPGGAPGSSAADAERRRPSPHASEQAAGEHPDPDQLTGTLPRLLPATGALLGSTTVLTALLFYFGRMHITGFFRYLRVNYTTLDLTLYDHLVRSADGLFVPVTAAAVGGVAAVTGHRVLHRLVPAARQRALRVLTPTAAALGVVSLALALLDLFGDGPLATGRPWLGGVALCSGVLLLAYATYLGRDDASSPPTGSSLDLAALAQGAFAFLLVTVGLFWAVGNYAIEVGTGRAQQLIADLPATADAVLYSERSLRLAVAGVTEVRCLDPEAAYRFRYDGLKLVLQSGDQYLLLPTGWTRENGTAVLLPRSDGIRLEFAPPGQQRQPVC